MNNPKTIQLCIYALITGATILIPSSLMINSGVAQSISDPIKSKVGQTPQSKSVITIVGTVYGINSTTGKVVVFALIDGVTEGKIFDATRSDVVDKNQRWHRRSWTNFI